MIKKIFIFLLFQILFSNYCFAINIVVIDLEEIIDNNKNYMEAIAKIEDDQKLNSKDLNTIEIELNSMFEEIEDSKLLLNENELNNLITNYNNQLSDFSNKVDLFNLHYEKQIINIRKTILAEIIKIVEKYAKNNNIDLILDSTSYLIATNEINITNIIKNTLDNVNLILEFKSFEN